MLFWSYLWSSAPLVWFPCRILFPSCLWRQLSSTIIPPFPRLKMKLELSGNIKYQDILPQGWWAYWLLFLEKKILLVKLYPCKVRGTKASEEEGPKTLGVARNMTRGQICQDTMLLFPKANEEVAFLCGRAWVCNLGSCMFFPSCFCSSNGAFPKASWNGSHKSFH